MGYIAFAIGFLVFCFFLAIVSASTYIPVGAMLPIGGLILLVAIIAIVIFGETRI